MEPTSGMKVVDIPLTEIFEDEDFNCRGHIAAYEVVELAEQIKEVGLQQPVTVQPWSTAPGYKYRLVMGHRRFNAFKVLKWETIPAVVKEGLSDLKVRVLNLTENLARKDLNLMQEAKAVEKFKVAGYTIQEVSNLIGMSKGWVQVRFTLLEQPEEIKDAAASGFLTQEQIKDIASMPSKELKFQAVKQIKESRERGEKKSIKVKEKKVNPLIKKLRGREEIFKMQDHITESIDANFGTRCLAWAAGEISDLELYRDIKEIADQRNVPYSVVAS